PAKTIYGRLEACPTGYSGSMRAMLAKLIPHRSAAVAIVLCLFGAGLRLWQVRESLWLDELHTAWCAVGTLGEVAPRAAIGNQSPLFFWLEWLLLNVLGPSELSLRLPSIVAGSLLPLAVFLIAKRWRMDAAGLIAAALVALDPRSIFFATEARPYAAVQLLAVIHIALTAEIATQPRIRLRCIWVTLGVLLFYLHYTAALLIAAEVVFLALLRVGRPLQTPYRLSRLLCDLALEALLCLPAAGQLQAIFAHRANWTAFIEREPIWEAMHWISLPAWWWAVLVVAACVGTQRESKMGANPDWLGRVPFVFLVICWFAVPLGIAWLATWTDLARLFFPRYVAVVFPAAMLFAGLCAYAVPWRWVRLTIGLLTIGVATWSSGIIANPSRRPCDRRPQRGLARLCWLAEPTASANAIPRARCQRLD
ncbi:MAG TPA: glycosyltransferase family 39 protein, partial [Pirellulaceae bacterium]|nr:glycosyltransferase family 39 protein [Pirellulaceae bacterium]